MLDLTPLAPRHAPSLGVMLSDADVRELAGLTFDCFETARRFVAARLLLEAGGRALTRVATLEGAVIGFAGLTRPERGAEAELSFAVTAALRRRGLGRLLCCDLLENAGCLVSGGRITARCWARNVAARALLDGLGFEAAGPGPEPDGPLEFVREGDPSLA